MLSRRRRRFLAALVITVLTVSGCAHTLAPGTTRVDEAARRRAIEILQQPRFQEPPGWVWGALVNEDGAHLRFGWVDPAGPVRGVIVLAPSFQSSLEQYFETARDLAARGFAVCIMDRRGQGGSDRWPHAEQRAHLMGGWREVRDLRQLTVLARARHPQAPAYLTGESLGGLIGLRLLHDSPGLFAAAAFSSPGIDFHTNGVPRVVLRAVVSTGCVVGLCAHYAPTQHDWAFNAQAGTPLDPTKDDPERALAAQGRLLLHPELIEGGATNGFVRTLLQEADTEESPGWAEQIQTPVLFGYTPTDKIARADVIQSVCRRMLHCTLARFDTSGHALFSDANPTRDTWMQNLEAFLEMTSIPRQ